ncbi:MAG TPA: glycosyltransferase family 4 protein, partial [Thermoleophilaceae bacterium]|nr:glycosyltransferase family 4 protein [Thermoleophilaceae bacterium]
TASLARALVALGHEVHLLCQDRGAADLPFVDAVGEWGAGELRVRVLREPVRCTAYVPDIGGLLPVYVVDEYEGFRAVPFPELQDRELDRYLEANVLAVREVAGRCRAEVALANHLIAGPAILARAVGGGVPYAVKVHGSALEYTVRPNRDRFLGLAREGLGPAAAVLVGSGHTAGSLWGLMEDPELPPRTRLGPPGVDVGAFRPRPLPEAQRRLAALAARRETSVAAGWGGAVDASSALRALDPVRGPVVAYVGKLIVSKGVDLLLAAWPLVVARVPGAQLCVVGFGTFRGALVRLIEALAHGDPAAAGEVARLGRELEGGPRGELRYLAAFLARLERGRLGAPFEDVDYRAAAPEAFARVHLTGRLEHEDLPDLLPACSAQVVPSTFPEAFGMVAAEAACCGALPVSASHSGLAEVTAALAEALPGRLRALLSFPLDEGAVESIAARLGEWLLLPTEIRTEATAALAAVARERFGWESVAEGVLKATAGRLDELPEPVRTPPT